MRQRSREREGEREREREREGIRGKERDKESQRESYSLVRLESEMFEGRIIFLPRPVSATRGFHDTTVRTPTCTHVVCLYVCATRSVTSALHLRNDIGLVYKACREIYTDVTGVTCALFRCVATRSVA